MLGLWLASMAATASSPIPGPGAAPVHPDDFADPFVLPTDNGYLAFATNTAWANVPVVRSDDLEGWSVVGDALPALPTWAQPASFLTWAPGVLDRGDGVWVLYFTTRDAARGLQCIGAATSQNPQGPYVDALGTPLVCQDTLGGSIDPYPFTDTDGTRWLLWKNDGNCCGQEVALWSRPLGPDGISFVGEATRLLVKDRAWEGPLIENPAIMRGDDGIYHLLYSANSWESRSYAVGAATCVSPAGPCTKIGEGPLLAATDPMWGPGGQAFFVDRDRRSWLVYHAWTAPLATYAAGGARSLRVRPLVLGGGNLTLAP